MTRLIYTVLALLLGLNAVHAQLKYANDSIETGAEQTELYIYKLKGQRVALVANQTSVIGSTHLLDSLLRRGVNVPQVFGPEHGFRGNPSNGAQVSDEVDPDTGVRIISLYGKKKNPTQEDLLIIIMTCCTSFR